MKAIARFLYRLCFTRDDDLDLLQLAFLVWIAFVGFALWQVGTGVWRWPSAAYALAGSIFATLAIAGTPTWIARLIAKSKTPGKVGRATGAAGVEPDLWRDDERDDTPPR